MNSGLAQRLGRPDLVGIPVDPYGGSSGIAQVGAVGSPVSGLGVSAGLEGRMTAGVLLVALAVVAGFYVWTRGVQA
jgi:hypothetical protein